MNSIPKQEKHYYKKMVGTGSLALVRNMRIPSNMPRAGAIVACIVQNPDDNTALYLHVIPQQQFTGLSYLKASSVRLVTGYICVKLFCMYESVICMSQAYCWLLRIEESHPWAKVYRLAGA